MSAQEAAQAAQAAPAGQAAQAAADIQATIMRTDVVTNEQS